MREACYVPNPYSLAPGCASQHSWELCAGPGPSPAGPGKRSSLPPSRKRPQGRPCRRFPGPGARLSRRGRPGPLTAPGATAACPGPSLSLPAAHTTAHARSPRRGHSEMAPPALSPRMRRGGGGVELAAHARRPP